MARKFGKRTLTLAFVILSLVVFLSCGVPTFWIQKYRDMPDIGDLQEWQRNEEDKRTIRAKNEKIEDYYLAHYGRGTPRFEASPIEIDESKLVIRSEVDGVTIPVAGRSTPGVKLTFAHLSDVQLRDEQVRLYDEKTSELADNLISSFEHHPFIEAFDGALYLSIVQSINATAEDTTREVARRPAFMIHTGDAIDAGVITELYEFVYISNELAIPWYNAIGNHDIGTFGNIDPDKIYVNDPFVDFITIHSKLSFINMHHNADQYSDLVPKTPTNVGHDQTTGMGDTLLSNFNGFDRLRYTPAEIFDDLGLCEDCPGYYSLEVKTRKEKTGDPAIQMIVLDTGFSFGAHGKIDEGQFRWLTNEIETCRNKLILVFGHHNIETIKDGERLTALFARHPSVIAYLCGHKHNHDINYYPGTGGGFGFWEVITDAIFAYPQQGSFVTISYDGKVGLLDVYAFNHTIKETYGVNGDEQISELFEHAQLAFKGAIEDISDEKRLSIDGNMEDRYARLRFPYPGIE